MSNKITLEEGIEIKVDIPPRIFDQITILYKKYMGNQIGDMVLTMEAIKLLLVDQSKVSYIDAMLDGKEGVTDIYSVLDDWAEKVLDVILKMNERKKKSMT